jgi:sugar lactone lactonase YvrE
MRIVSILIVCFLSLFLVFQSGYAFEVSGLVTPESFIRDPQTGEYYISNIDGNATTKDNNGFITKLDKMGKIIALKFIEGGKGDVTLHAPKGLTLLGNTLYVTDIDTVYGFDKASKKLLHRHDLKGLGALFLNDITHDDQGTLYISDTTVFVNPEAQGTIFKIETENQNKVSILLRDSNLTAPNGLVIHPRTKRLLVNTWGTGKILEIGEEGTIKVLVADPNWINLDGLDFDENENLYTSSFTAGIIYKIAPDLKMEIIKTDLKTPADINIDRTGKQILVPLFNENAATTIDLAS